MPENLPMLICTTTENPPQSPFFKGGSNIGARFHISLNRTLLNKPCPPRDDHHSGQLSCGAVAKNDTATGQTPGKIWKLTCARHTTFVCAPFHSVARHNQPPPSQFATLSARVADHSTSA